MLRGSEYVDRALDRRDRTVLEHKDEAARHVAWHLRAGEEGVRLAGNPVADVEKPRNRRSGEIDVFSPEEVRALMRAAASQQDAAI